MINLLIRIKPFLTDVVTLARLAFAFITGRYRHISKKAIAAIFIGAVYLLNPIDFVPDFFSLFGLLDDAAVLGFITYLLKDDLNKFRDWDENKS